MSDDFPVPPLPYKAIRERIRTGLASTRARQLWWPILVKTGYKQSVENIPDISGLARKRYTWAMKSLTGSDEAPDVNLDWDEAPQQEIAEQVMQLLNRQYHMPEPGLVVPFVNFASSILTNKAICFSFCCDFMDRPGWFISPEPVSHRLKLYTFRELFKRLMVQTYNQLDAIGALSDAYLNIILVEMLAPVLTTEQHKQVLDAYFIDGVKTLYRFGLGLFKMFKDRIKSNEFRSGEAFWTAMKSYSQGGIDFAALSNLSLDHKKSIFQKSTVPPRAQLLVIENNGRVALGDLARDPLNLPYTLGDSSSNSMTGNEGINPNDSTLLDSVTGNALNSFIPPDARMEGFELMFSTYNDGWSFETLYDMTAHLEPCVILLRTVESDALIGMYMSKAISPPSMDVRGDGQCFCFRLDGANAAKFSWSAPEDKIGVSDTATANQFAHCCSSYMAFGGSRQHGTNALRIEADLAHASSGPSDTYNNSALVPEEDKQAFDVQNVEVFCGRPAVQKSGKSKSVARK